MHHGCVSADQNKVNFVFKQALEKSFLKSDQRRLLGPRFETAFASGWMAGGGRGFGVGYHHGFVMPDHTECMCNIAGMALW